MNNQEKQARVTIALPAELWKRTKNMAVSRDMRYQELVAIALEQYVQMLERAASRSKTIKKDAS